MKTLTLLAIASVLLLHLPAPASASTVLSVKRNVARLQMLKRCSTVANPLCHMLLLRHVSAKPDQVPVGKGPDAGENYAPNLQDIP